MNSARMALMLAVKRDFAPLVSAMFGSGEQGLLIVPSYTRSLFQDAAMTIPAVVGGPVAKALDLSGRGNHVTFADVTLEQDAAGKKYLAANGTSSTGVTAAIDFSGTDKMTLCAGLHKASDAGYGILVELSASVAANAGSFYVTAPDGPVANYASTSRGAAAADGAQLATAATYAAPSTNVVTATHDIAGDSTIVRVNGVAATPATGDKGAGNFGNYPLYIFARNAGSLFFNGRLYGLVVRGAACTAGQIDDAERYMARLSGVNL